MAKTKYYLPRSKLNTNKGEAQNIAKYLRKKGRYKDIRVVKRDFAKDEKTKTPAIKGYWVRVKK